jgi:L-alanine-DL-glutamate epimerase-like enolase superfamily enzyme
MDDVFETPLKLDAEGFLTIPDGPGYGFKWSAEGIRRLSQGISITESRI